MNITVRTPFADAFDEHEDGFEAPDALGISGAEAIAREISSDAVLATARGIRAAGCAGKKNPATLSREAGAAHLDSLAVRGIVIDALPTSEGFLIGIALWLGVIVAAVGCVALASVAFGDELPPPQWSALAADAGAYTDMLYLAVRIADKDIDMCLMATELPPDNKNECVIQYRAGGTLVFPRGFAIHIEPAGR